MNIIKGIDRIALIIAIIALFPGFMGGVSFTQEKFKMVTPEYKEWVKENQDNLDSMKQKGDKIPKRLSKFAHVEDWDLDLGPTKYQDPPLWQPIMGGLIFAPLYSMAVLFGIRWASRGIRALFLWIIEGFKDDEGNKKP